MLPAVGTLTTVRCFFLLVLQRIESIHCAAVGAPGGGTRLFSAISCNGVRLHVLAVNASFIPKAVGDEASQR